MKKIEVKLCIKDGKDKQKVMKAVSTLTGIDSISADVEAGKLTIVGEVDPVVIIAKLRKKWGAQLDSVGEPEKKEEKKDDKKKDDENKDDENKDMNDHLAELVDAYKNYNPRKIQCYVVYGMEENPNSCVVS